MFSPKDGVCVFNYASICYLLAIGAYCQGFLVDWLGLSKPQNQPKKLGWVFANYENGTFFTKEYSPMRFTALVIDPNTGYQGFSSKFQWS